ncbi:response regulator [Pseudoalteromonas sp. MMG013]|uniref:Two-component system, OmpR family, response regulator BaeR n=1 Tax=Pseudoalteromonas aurantia 208 TaxID=1314867 RepID=A0ABR9ED53_9GAMM|nr:MULTISPECIES: response regulator [Pseudoalteromonas]MBE0368918.1 two-component system, OmpR family, response regulator BaeR [Pseudoalteromonas aurantia 208]MBQ4848132.1 response regulator [Pseudoalteromonas sp. MMG005]MBQ4863282.1 response regulator [Pseudoalteromonas sp. MMG013]
MDKPRILIVEDEPKLADILSKYLTKAEYETHIVVDGADAEHAFNHFDPHLILLDIMLPNVDGIEICKIIRAKSNVPVIMTTAKVEEIDRLLGLEIGADDYVCKPYSPREVVARVKAVLRRMALNSNGEKHDAEKKLKLDDNTFFASFLSNSISLTHVEYLLLKSMQAHPGRIYSRDKLMDHIYDDDRIVSDRTIDSHIKKIRKKLHDIAPEHEFIHSIYGAGYKFEAQGV